MQPTNTLHDAVYIGSFCYYLKEEEEEEENVGMFSFYQEKAQALPLGGC